jgi:uncharacterized protein YkwD
MKISVIVLIASLLMSCVKTVEEVPSESNIEITSDAVDDRTQLLEFINKQRAAGCNCGSKKMPKVGAVSYNSLLDASSLRHANDMKNKNIFSHTGSDKSNFSKRITEAGYAWKFAGENIAKGQLNASEVFQDWKKSPSHCENFMNGNYKELGLARVGDIWVQDFGTKK